MKDLTINEIMAITGIGKTKAYEVKFYGEYRCGRQRLIRREEFFKRRELGQDVAMPILSADHHPAKSFGGFND